MKPADRVGRDTFLKSQFTKQRHKAVLACVMLKVFHFIGLLSGKKAQERRMAPQIRIGCDKLLISAVKPIYAHEAVTMDTYYCRKRECEVISPKSHQVGGLHRASKSIPYHNAVDFDLVA